MKKKLPALRDTLIIRAVAQGWGVHLHKLGPPPLGPAPPRGMLSCEAPPIDEFQPNQSSPSNKKARDTMDSITCITKSRRASENSMHRWILTAVPLQKCSKIDESTQRQPAALDPAEPAQFQHSHCKRHPLIALEQYSKVWRVNFKSIRRADFNSRSSKSTTARQPTARSKRGAI